MGRARPFAARRRAVRQVNQGGWPALLGALLALTVASCSSPRGELLDGGAGGKPGPGGTGGVGPNGVDMARRTTDAGSGPVTPVAPDSGEPAPIDGPAGNVTDAASAPDAPISPPPPGCQPRPELCDNGRDDDCDQKSDCADTDCGPGTTCGTDMVCSGAASCIACRAGQTCDTPCATGRIACTQGQPMCVLTPLPAGRACGGAATCSGGQKREPRCDGNGSCGEVTVNCPSNACNASGTDCQPCGTVGNPCCGDRCDGANECRNQRCEASCAGVTCKDQCHPSRGACWLFFYSGTGGGCGTGFICDTDSSHCVANSRLKRIFQPTDDLAELRRICTPLLPSAVRDFCASEPEIQRRRASGQSVKIEVLVVSYRRDGGYHDQQENLTEVFCP